MAKAASKQSRWPLSGLISIFEKRNKDDIGGYCRANTEIEIIGIDGCSGFVYRDQWEDNTVINMMYLLKGDHLKLIFDCGINDFFYDGNKRMHQQLMERNIPHDYIERPGSHNWEYWANAIQYQLLYFGAFFKS